ncbi:MAG: Gfo/Idh/MocA family oxidoreductase [Nitrospirota bacterium]
MEWSVCAHKNLHRREQAVMKILQIGLGGFGKNHLRAWAQTGRVRDLFVADLSQGRLKEAQDLFGIPPERLSSDYRQFLPQADIVDIVTPSDSHAEICEEALELGKDVFVEKPMTMTVAEADRIAAAVERSRRILQVGYYYRYHPITKYVREQVRLGQLGALRYLSGQFMGFKRARTDVGVTHTDGIHFIDLFNDLIGETPREAYAVIRDHFGRGLEDFSIVLLRYPSGVVVKVESGYVQPGNWVDRVVPNAMTTKDITLVGEKRTIRADFEIDKVEVFEVRHELQNGIWTPVHGPCTSPRLRSVTPVELVALELESFLESVAKREIPSPNVTDSGTVLARIMEAVYRSAESGRPATVEPVGEAVGLAKT